MVRKLIILSGIIFFIIFGSKGQDFEKDGIVFYNAFSHNDYWRSRPLWDALSYRINSVEADLWLIDGELFVAHDRSEIKPEHTFEKMYLKPLTDLILQNGGKVFANSDRPFFLMLDCNTSGEALYPVLKKMIEPYKNLFCSVDDGVYKEGAVLLFLSGNRPFDTLPIEKNRHVFLDGRISDLSKCIPQYLMPVISDNYAAHFSWNGEGVMPDEELQKMRSLLSLTHQEGKLLRWWGTPETTSFIQFLLEEGIDLISFDDLQLLYQVADEKLDMLKMTPEQRAENEK